MLKSGIMILYLLLELITFKSRKTIISFKLLITKGLNRTVVILALSSLHGKVILIKILMQGKLFQRCTHFFTAVYCLWAEK